jgi:Protein of unknown function (DUF2752)
MVIFPTILLILPKTFFDHGPTFCVYTLITGINCLGCGLTRACMRLIHFDFVGAWEFNKLSFIVFPALIYYYLRFFVANFRQIIAFD